MKDLEKLLSKVLPEKVSGTKSKTSGKEIHQLTEGLYMDEDRKVFQKKYYLPLDKKENEIIIGKFEIPRIIRQYAGLPAQKLEELLFIDTETTGLAGGTGTYAFLIGLGYFENDLLWIEQLFLTDISGEQVLLLELEKYLERFKTFVSFNGKSFDIPLIRNRFIFNLMEDATAGFENLDLLHLSRRIWKNTLPDCSLGTIEREILGIIRHQEEDISGSEIPQEYFYYLETRDSTDMVKVMYHNYYDILSMVVLLDKMSEILVNHDSVEILEEIFGMAKLFYDQDDSDKAEKLFLKILTIHPHHKESRKRLSYLYKRSNDMSEAVELWIKAAGNKEIYALIELAKYNEHYLKNIPVALNYTQEALKIIYGSFYQEDTILEELHHRLERLQGKIKHEN